MMIIGEKRCLLLCAVLTSVSLASSGAVMQLAAYSVQASAPPFPAFVVMGFINGMGLAFQVRP